MAVLGEVNRPGVYTTKDEVLGIPTVADAIQYAGGITLKANLKEVSLIRRMPGKDAEFIIAKINLINLIKDGNQTQNPYIFDGDTIKITAADSDIALVESNTTLSPEFIEVNVIGAVNNPGRLRIKNNSLLSQAIFSAGGVAPFQANTSKYELYRINNLSLIHI